MPRSRTPKIGMVGGSFGSEIGNGTRAQLLTGKTRRTGDLTRSKKLGGGKPLKGIELVAAVRVSFSPIGLIRTGAGGGVSLCS